MHGIRRLVLVVATAVASVWQPGRLAAQELRAVEPGRQVRLWSSGFGLSGDVARVLQASADSLRFGWEDGDPVTVPISGIERLELWRPRSPGAGTRIGATAGALAGGAVGVLAGSIQQGRCDSGLGDDCAGYPLVLGVGGVLAGSVVGGIIGRVRPGGRWDNVPLGGAP